MRTDKNSLLLKTEEEAAFALRALYGKYGYRPFKMSKFEEYDLYVRNKDFLVSDRVITFTDTNGRLMALKPDVTLSIIKNDEFARGCKQKFCYNENVYRVSGGTHQFKEIMQTGLECFGDIDFYDISEVVLLATKSLDFISSDFVLEISHNIIFEEILAKCTGDKVLQKEISKLISEKNSHDLERLCAANGIPADKSASLVAVSKLYGDMDSVLSRLEDLALSDRARAVLADLSVLRDIIKSEGYADKVRFDFSVINDMKYYNGIVFRGFAEGICESVLSGGQYGRLMQRMGKQSDAVGFAIYLDLLEGLKPASTSYDVDVLLLYSESTPKAEIAARVKALTEENKSVSAQREIPEKLRFGEIIDIRGEATDD